MVAWTIFPPVPPVLPGFAQHYAVVILVFAGLNRARDRFYRAPPGETNYRAHVTRVNIARSVGQLTFGYESAMH